MVLSQSEVKEQISTLTFNSQKQEVKSAFVDMSHHANALCSPAFVEINLDEAALSDRLLTSPEAPPSSVLPFSPPPLLHPLCTWIDGSSGGGEEALSGSGGSSGS